MEQLPYFNNNEYLFKLKDSLKRVLEHPTDSHGKSGFRGGGTSIPFLIPVVFWLYFKEGEDINVIYPPDIIKMRLDELNKIYQNNGLPIRFALVCAVPIKVDDTEFNQIQIHKAANDNRSKGALNIHVVRKLSIFGVSAGGYCPYGSFIAILRESPGSTIAHEFGHYCGLSHTHIFSVLSCNANATVLTNHWWSGLLNPSKYLSSFPALGPIGTAVSLSPVGTLGGGRSEAVQRDWRCNVTGDALCDTEADPCLLITGLVNNCIYVGNLQDFEENAYHPDPLNVMTYTPLNNKNEDCARRFSPSQQTIILKSVMSSFSFDDGFPDKFERNDMLEMATELRADGQKQEHSLVSFGEGFCSNDDIDFIWVNRYGLETPGAGKQILGNLVIEIEAIDGVENPIGTIDFFEMSSSGSGATRGTTLLASPEILGLTDKVVLSCNYINPLTKNIGIQIKRHPKVEKGKYTIKAYLDTPQPYMVLPANHTICLGDIISVEGVPEGATIKWVTSVWYDYVKISDTQIKITDYNSFNGISVPVQAVVNFNGCEADLTENIKLGSSLPPTPLSPLDVKADVSENGCTLKSVTFTIPNAKEYIGTNIDWQINCNVGCIPGKMITEISSDKSSMTVYPNMTSSTVVVALQGKLTIKADCGNHEESQNLFYHFLRPEGCIGKELIVNVHPNPANEVINVDIETPTLTSSGDPDPNHDEPQLREIRIVSPLEGMRYYRQTTETNFTIELDGYNNGIYYVQVVSGEKTTQKLFIIQKE